MVLDYEVNLLKKLVVLGQAASESSEQDFHECY